MKTLIYPITYNNRELIIFNQMIKGFEDIIYVTLDNIESYFENLAVAYGIKNFDVAANFNMALEEIDVVIFLDGDKLRNSYLDKIRLAERYGKKIYLTNSVKNLISDDYDCDNLNILDPIKKVIDYENLEILDFDIPIIGVMGLGEYCDKFTCELLIRNYFTTFGYNVLQFGSKNFSSLFGFESIPEYIYKKSIPMTERSVNFNKYATRKAETEKPDIIIVGMPEGIMPMNNSLLNDFGEIPQIISNAFAIDYVLLGIYYQNIIDKKFIDYLAGNVKFKFGSELAALCISNTAVETDVELYGRALKYYHLDVNNITPSYDIQCPILHFNTRERNRINNVFSEIYSSLIQNVDVI